MIKEIKILSNELQVTFDNKMHDNFPNIWLRDHAKDDLNWDARSNQRKTYTAKTDPNIQIKNAEVTDGGKSVKILWSDFKTPITYSSDFLSNNLINKDLNYNPINLWKSDEVKNEVFVTYEDAINEKKFKNFLNKLYKYGFCVIQNCEKNINSVEKIANKIGYVRQSIFGGLWSFESDENMADSAYTQEELRPHTDSTYSNDAPGLQLLLCRHYNAEGGHSIMVDGFKIAEDIKNQNNEIYQILTSVDVTGEYKGDGVALRASRPILKLDKNKNLVQVSFNNYDRAPFRLQNNEMIQFYEALKEFDIMANSDDYQWKRVLKPGELLIFNNWRVLHGRSLFKGSRKMSGCYINKEDFDSCCRMNKIIF